MVIPTLDFCFECRSDSSARAEWLAAKARFEALANDPTAPNAEVAAALNAGVALAARYGGRVACRAQHPDTLP